MCMKDRCMLPSSHQVHTEARQSPAEGALLAEAFSDFISASARLELSYRELQMEVGELSAALSERNQALSASLSENRNMGFTLERILEAMPCGVLVVNAEGSVRLANPEANRLLALSGTGAPSLGTIGLRLGLNLEFEMPEDYAEEGEQELSFESVEGRHWIAVRRVRLPGPETGAANYSAQQLNLDPGSRRAESVLMLRDISARKRMEEERESARDAVALAQVSAVLAHEIRNPLASLELFAGLITDSPERSGEWLSHLRAGIRSLSGTVNNVLTLHGHLTLAPEPVDVATEARLAVNFLQPLAQQAGISLQLEMEPDELWTFGNKSAFHQILLNLCSNALRHTPPQGRVYVICAAPAEVGEPIRLSVIDNGCGMSPHVLARLFEPGFSGSGTTPGLGLAVCQRLLRQHGGALRVQSRVGQGSTFTLEFPQA